MLHGVIDSPPDQSETLRYLEELERRVYGRRRRARGDQVSDSSNFASEASPQELVRELWGIVLDVVCAPLWVRMRAAGLLTACASMHQVPLAIDRKNSQWLRAVLSSTCQVLDDLDTTVTHQAEQLFTWLEFLQHVLLATSADVFATVLRHTLYATMLNKLLRVLSTSSTKLFAAVTMCLASFHVQEVRCGRQPTILVDSVLVNHQEGQQHLGGALLHVINSCGCPCPDNRLVHLWNSLRLLGDILAHKAASQLIFVNDFRVLIDIVLRECNDLPLDDRTRLPFLRVLEQALPSPFFLQAQMYRKKDLLSTLQNLLAVGVQDDSQVPREVVVLLQQLLLQYIDVLD